jgi:hypoxanthine-guanine phosphoribosyltransferase
MTFFHPLLPTHVIRSSAIDHAHKMLLPMIESQHPLYFFVVCQGGRTYWSWLRGALETLLKYHNRPVDDYELSFIRSVSYENNQPLSDDACYLSSDAGALERASANQHAWVVIVDDICESGRTIARIKRYMAQFYVQPSCAMTLFSRHTSATPIAFNADNISHAVEHTRVFSPWVVQPSLFLVGCGLDHRNKYRDLPFLAYLKEH